MGSLIAGSGTLALWLFASSAYGLYAPQRKHSLIDEVLAVAKSDSLATLFLIAPIFFLTSPSAVPTDVLYPEQTSESLVEAVRFFEAHERDFDPAAIRAAVQRFDRPRYLAEFKDFVARNLGAGRQ